LVLCASIKCLIKDWKKHKIISLIKKQALSFQIKLCRSCWRISWLELKIFIIFNTIFIYNLQSLVDILTMVYLLCCKNYYKTYTNNTSFFTLLIKILLTTSIISKISSTYYCPGHPSLSYFNLLQLGILTLEECFYFLNQQRWTLIKLDGNDPKVFWHSPGLQIIYHL
jgi:hypothetical protein